MKWFDDMKIASKLTLSFVVMLCLMVFLGVFSLQKLSQVNLIVSKNIIKERMPNIIAASDLNTNTSDFRIAEFQHYFSARAAKSLSRKKECRLSCLR